MKKIVLTDVITNKNTVAYKFSASEDLKKYFSGKPFKIEYQENIETVPKAVLAIPFVANVLPIVWLTDSTLVLDELDEDFNNCIDRVKKAYIKMFPKATFKGQVLPKKIVKNQCENQKKSAMLFSGGLDSIQTLITHISEKPDLISLWGSDIKYENKAGWKIIYSSLNKVAKQNDFNHVVIKTAFREFDNESILSKEYHENLRDGYWHGIKHALGILSHVAPLAYINGYKNLYIASSNCPLDKDIRCASHPTTDNEIRFAGCQVKHDGFEFSRQDKCRNVVTYCENNKKYFPLHVCWESQSGENCSQCEKCYRTMFGIIAEGGDPQNYGFFNVEKKLKKSLSYFVNNKNQFVKIFTNQWIHIQNAFIKNKDSIKNTSYWKGTKWILKVNFNNIYTIRYGFFMRCVLLAKKILKKIYRKIRSIKRKFFEKIELLKFLASIKKAKRKGYAFLIMTPEHQNLGDQAIATAETVFFKEKKINYFEITDKQVFYLSKHKALKVLNGSLVLIHGGGNLGTLWMDVENLTRNIIMCNPKSKIIMLPNTIYYGKEDKEELKKSIEIYNAHKNLYIYAREKTSYDFMKSIYNNVLLCPDMVLSLNKSSTQVKRKGCLICLRNDVEKTMSQKDGDCVLKQVKTVFGKDYRITDMINETPFDYRDREKVLNKKYDSFKKAELVITDRLHGMIFSCITGTPCIVLNSKSPKVKGCYEWIKRYKNIRFCDDASKLTDIIKEIKGKSFKYNNSYLKNYYNALAKHIKEFVK